MGGGWATAFTAPERIRAVRDVRAHASRRYGWIPTAGQLKSDATEQIHPAGASAGWSALVQSGPLSDDECGEVVEGGGPPGLGVVAAGGVGPVAERHPRLGAVVVEFHARDRGLVHSHLWHWVGA